MSHVQLESAAQHEVVFAVPAHLENGENSEATACFAVNFDINDHGIGLEFADSRRLADFFKKIRTLIDKALRDSNYRARANYIKQVIAKTHGLDRAADIVEQAYQNYQTDIKAER